jgi:cell division protein FtsB
MTNIDWTAVLLFSTFLSLLFCCVLLMLLYNAYREVHQLKLVRDALQEENTQLQEKVTTLTREAHRRTMSGLQSPLKKDEYLSRREQLLEQDPTLYLFGKRVPNN